MKKSDCIKQIVDGAKLYDANLSGKEFLFIGRDTTFGSYWWFETRFLPRHYAHLAGISPSEGKSAVQLYDLCLHNRLRPSDFQLNGNAIAAKLDVLPEMMKLPWTAKMIGSFNDSGNYLCTEKLAGNVRGCMGFIHDTGIEYDIPNTLLKGDIRDMVNGTYQLIAVFRKAVRQPLYDATPISVAKFLKNKEIELPAEVSSLISI